MLTIKEEFQKMVNELQEEWEGKRTDQNVAHLKILMSETRVNHSDQTTKIEYCGCRPNVTCSTEWMFCK